ncbi:MAG: DoxX family protein [Granulosicoccus sp.]
MTTATEITLAPSAKGWNIGLWTAQIALAALYAMAVYMHVLMSPVELAGMGAVWAETAPIWLIRFIGFAELAGVIGLIVPAATRIKPELTVYAAMGLLAIQALAVPFHVIRGEMSVLPFNLIYVALAMLIIWGRTRKSPIAAKV